MKNEIAALNYVRNDRRDGFTLIEVILAVMVVTVAVSATLVIMAKMMGYTVNRGQAVDISNAITISQMAIDRVRDQKFPPTSVPIGDLTTDTENVTMSNTAYICNTQIDNYLGTTFPAATEYIGTTDSLLDNRSNLLRVTVTVSKNGKQILKTVTYKTRNGYY